MAGDKRTSEYPIVGAELPADSTLIDVSVLISSGPDVFDTRSIPYEFLKGNNIIAFEDAVDMGIGSTGNIISLDWNCSGKTVTPTHLKLKNTAGAKGGGSIQIQIGSTSGGSDILPLTTLTDYSLNGSYIILLMGSLPEMLSDSDTFFLKIVEGATAAHTDDIELYGNHKDV